MPILKIKDEKGNWINVPALKGTDGKSAYEIWLEQGNTGTEQDFINSLVGKDGKDGVNGTNGVDGKDGANGKDGYTPIKGVDYFDGKDGSNGTDGKDGKDGENGTNGQDGYSPTATVTQTEAGATITITDKNGTTTTNITNGKDGTNGTNGTNGKDGADGYTPVKGTDYWTVADKQEIETFVINEVAKKTTLQTVEFVNDISKCTDTSKMYVLPDGYIYAYMSGEGNMLVPNFTNVNNPTLTTDTTLTTTSTGWIKNSRINSSKAITTAEGYDISNFVSISKGSTLRMQGINCANAYGRIYLYNDGAYKAAITTNGSEYLTSIDENGIEVSTTTLIERLQATIGASNPVGAVSIRVGGSVNTTIEDVIITIDEEIKYTSASSYEWANTGIKYISSNTDLIGIVDENNVIYLSDNNLPSGTYTLKYGDETYETIGTITVE